MPFIDFEGCDIFYDEWGTGTPVVLTAGGLDPATSLRPLVDRLADRFHVIIWDRPNQGLSHVEMRGPSDLDLYAAALAALLTALEVPPAFLAGPSEGSRVVMRTALRTPELVRGLFLWQTSAGPIGDQLRYTNYEQYALAAEAGGMDAVAHTPWHHERIKFNPANYARLLAMDPTEFAATMRRWSQELRPEDPMLGHTEQMLREVHAPAWIVEGVDAAHPPEASRRVAELLSHGTSVPAPYGSEDAHAIAHRVEHNPRYNLYALLPGIGELLEAFVTTN